MVMGTLVLAVNERHGGHSPGAPPRTNRGAAYASAPVLTDQFVFESLACASGSYQLTKAVADSIASITWRTAKGFLRKPSKPWPLRAASCPSVSLPLMA